LRQVRPRLEQPAAAARQPPPGFLRPRVELVQQPRVELAAAALKEIPLLRRRRPTVASLPPLQSVQMSSSVDVLTASATSKSEFSMSFDYGSVYSLRIPPSRAVWYQNYMNILLVCQSDSREGIAGWSAAYAPVTRAAGTATGLHAPSSDNGSVSIRSGI
jgi:hypothetical protein